MPAAAALRRWAEPVCSNQANFETPPVQLNLEGHPNTAAAIRGRATGSLGQGLSVGAGMALAARLDHLNYNTYVLLGDGEIAEGAVWEAMSFAGIYKLNNLIAISGQ